MRILILLTVFFSSISALADNVSNYDYYQVWKELPTDKPMGAVFIKKSDPCIVVFNQSKATSKRFCKLLPSKLNFETDYPTIYPYKITFDGISLEFIVAAPWAEQRCRIDLDREEISCIPTGK
ncbi:hypothetical protein KCN56_08895 [Photobacterium galatheae]|uniref:hypothetical protein n=1 Tax=Photobacterium galatheae TaxID=1654360 RepID=UPI00202CF1FD|nr:hypothetical protein [Photobacterium galatheae]MCM0148674.1 hypothetical protein [Photobacterium galatheae]